MSETDTNPNADDNKDGADDGSQNDGGQNDGGQNTDDTNTGDDGGEGGDDGDDSGDGDNDDKPLNPDDYEVGSRGYKKPKSDDGDGDDDLDKDDADRINKVVDKRMSAADKRISDQDTKIEVNDYVIENPGMSKYKQIILKYAKTPAFAQVAISDIAKIVAGDDMKKIGAKLERDASDKVKKSKSGGSSVRGKKSSGFDAKGATFDQMEDEIARVKGQA